MDSERRHGAVSRPVDRIPGRWTSALWALPTDGPALVRYLTNSYKGVGKKTAERLVEEFGSGLFEVLHRRAGTAGIDHPGRPGGPAPGGVEGRPGTEARALGRPEIQSREENSSAGSRGPFASAPNQERDPVERSGRRIEAREDPS